jgi:hypothetical protein
MPGHETRELADSWIQGVACGSEPQIIFVFVMLENDSYYVLIGDCKLDGKICRSRVAWIAGVHARSGRLPNVTFSNPYMRAYAYANSVHKTASGTRSRSRTLCHTRQPKDGSMSQGTEIANQGKRVPLQSDQRGPKVI